MCPQSWGRCLLPARWASQAGCRVVVTLQGGCSSQPGRSPKGRGCGSHAAHTPVSPWRPWVHDGFTQRQMRGDQSGRRQGGCGAAGRALSRADDHGRTQAAGFPAATVPGSCFEMRGSIQGHKVFPGLDSNKRGPSCSCGVRAQGAEPASWQVSGITLSALSTAGRACPCHLSLL